jgi:hypothetical protein
MDTSSLDAIYARFPTLAIKLQGTAVVAQPKSYAIFDPYAGVPITTNNPPGIIGLNPGISPDDGDVKVIGQSFMTDNLVSRRTFFFRSFSRRSYLSEESFNAIGAKHIRMQVGAVNM